MKKKLIIAITIIIILGIFIFLNDMINERRREEEGDYPTKDEFVRTVDCAELFNTNSPGTRYIISFDLKTKVPGKVIVYPQNGDSYRYYWDPYPVIDATNEYVRYEIEIEPYLANEDVAEAYLSFYGTYGSGVIPVIKDLVVKPK